LRAIRLFTSKISDSIAEGAQFMSDKQVAEMTAAADAAQAQKRLWAKSMPGSRRCASEEISMEEVLGLGFTRSPWRLRKPKCRKPRARPV